MSCKNTKSVFQAALAVCLAVVMGALSPLQAFALSKAEEHLANTAPTALEAELENQTIGNFVGKSNLYVSDVKIATGKTADEAKKALHDAGYLVYDCDLNEGTETPKRSYKSMLILKTLSDQQVPKRYTYLGYKLTTDRTRAITNLYVMDEEGGYDKFSYSEFAKSKMPGLQTMVAGMQASCNEMRKKLAAGSYAAKVAKEYLDLFCVPETSAGKTGVPLGDYLLDTKRTENDFRDLLLVLDTLMLNMINAQLAVGVSDSEVCTTTANGGKTAAGSVASTYTSRNGITGYTSLADNGGWLQKAAETMAKNTEFANAKKTDTSPFFAGKMTEFGAQIAAIKRAFADNTLSAAAIAYLKSEKLESSKGAISTALGTTGGCTAYDLLTKGTDRMLCLFLEGLPTICEAHRFIDVLEVCATDCNHRLPVDFTYNKQVNVDWAPAVVSAIDDELLTPSDKTAYNAYNTEIEAFVELFKQFTAEYENACAAYDKDNDKPLADANADTPAEAEKIAADALENQTEVDAASYIYYVGIRDYFSKYTVYNGKGATRISLLDYLIQATKGKEATDATVKARIYPVVKTLTAAKKYSYKSNGMMTFFLDSVLGTDELAGMEAGLSERRLELEDAFGSKTFSIWTNSNKDLMERDGNDSGVAMTSRRVMDTLNNQNFQNAFPNEETATEKYKKALTKTGVAAMCAIAAGMIAYAGVKLTFLIGGYEAMEGVGLLASLFLSGCGLTACVSCMLVVFSVVAVIIIAAVAIVYAILYLIELLKPEPTPVHTKIPDIMLDCIEDGNNRITGICRYNVVTDTDGAPADINAFVARKWIALYYTKNSQVGSPLTMGPNGEFFAQTSASTTGPEKSVPLAKFLTASNFNLNNHCYYDTCSGKYLYFFTEDSLAGKTTEIQGVKKYIDAIAIGHSTSDDGTRAYVLRQQGYQLLDANLSPNAKYNTYIAFHTTNDKASAITDIRAAYATAAKEIRYGDNIYESILDETMLKVPATTCEDATAKRQQTSFSYGLYTSKSSRVGDPLLAAGIRYTTDLADVPADADVVSFFGGMPLDFNTYDRQGNEKDGDGVSVYDKHYYVYFQSERDANVDYKSKTYLAGLSFFSGSEDMFTEADTTEYSMANYASYAYGCKLIPANLTPGLYNNDEDVTYLGYVYTHNPKRALTDLAVFTGEPKSGGLPQNISVAGDGYCSCDVYTQGDYWYYGNGGGSRQRLMRSSHAYFTTASTEYYDYYWPEDVAVMPRALYACGPQTDVGPIELGDVVISTTGNKPPTNVNARGNAHLSRLTTEGTLENLENQLLGDTWHSVHAIDQYYFDKYDANGALLSYYDIGLGMNPESSALGTGSLYIYYRNGAGPRVRGNYVSNVAICGSATANNAYNEARVNALSVGEDIVNLDNPMTVSDGAFTDMANNRETVYKKTNDDLKNYNDNCYLVAVSYTDNLKDAVGGVRVLEQERGKALLPTATNLPQYDTTVESSSYRQTAVASTNGEVGAKDSSGRATFSGYATYVTHNGTAINRVTVRFVNTAPKASVSGVSAGSENGAAEYFAQRENTTEPFMLKNEESGTMGCLCLQRNLDVSGNNNDYYVMSIKVIEDTSYDGTLTMSAVKLGAMGYPYIVDFDIAESQLSYGCNTIAVLGIERTSDPRLAIKDIRLSSDDLGATYTYNYMRYDRVNDTPVRLDGADKNGVYIYTTDGSDSRKILWSEIDKEHTDWETFDWAHLDFVKSAAKDPTFNTQLEEVLSKYPSLRSYVNTISSDEYTDVEDATRLKWSKQTAITNVGYSPSSTCPEQSIRRRYGRTAKEVYWAGCPSYGTDKLPVAVTNSTPIFTVSTFGNTESVTGLRFTNAGNGTFTPYESPADRLAAEESASVFAKRDIVAVSVLSAVFLIALAAIYVVYRKRKLGKEER